MRLIGGGQRITEGPRTHAEISGVGRTADTAAANQAARKASGSTDSATDKAGRVQSIEGPWRGANRDALAKRSLPFHSGRNFR